jgi:hypothetical protein
MTNELCPAVDSLVLGEISDVHGVVLGPLLVQCQVDLIVEARLHRAVTPFSECHFPVPISVGDRKKVAAKSSRFHHHV